jgi:phospholipid-binding lipoprotein MlaA
MKLRILACLFSLGLYSPLQAEIYNEFLQREHPEFPAATEPEPAAAEVRNPDPWEKFNRKAYAFNDALDRAFLKPTAKGIKHVMPEPINQGVHNFFDNLADVGTGINNLLQGKFRHALSDTGRVLVNTTMGVGGLFDIASRMNLEKHNEDFGQTLGKWGVQPGPYLILPILGPSSLRDRVGYTIDLAFDPLVYLDDEEAYAVLLAASILEERASLLEASDLLDTAALDPYTFQRDAYLQKREYDVNDGEEDDDF